MSANVDCMTLETCEVNALAACVRAETYGAPDRERVSRLLRERGLLEAGAWLPTPYGRSIYNDLSKLGLLPSETEPSTLHVFKLGGAGIVAREVPYGLEVARPTGQLGVHAKKKDAVDAARSISTETGEEVEIQRTHLHRRRSR